MRLNLEGKDQNQLMRVTGHNLAGGDKIDASERSFKSFKKAISILAFLTTSDTLQAS